MPKYFKKLKYWCNANQGLLSVIAIILGLFQNTRIDFISGSTFLDNVKTILRYKTEVPVYLLIILVLVLLFLAIRFKKRYTIRNFSIKYLVGTWKNEFTIEGKTHSEIAQITEEAYYIINNEHRFNIENFLYDKNKREIKFTKVSIKLNSTLKFFNTLTIQNNELLIGTENNHTIRYIKLSE